MSKFKSQSEDPVNVNYFRWKYFKNAENITKRFWYFKYFFILKDPYLLVLLKNAKPNFKLNELFFYFNEESIAVHEPGEFLLVNKIKVYLQMQ